MDRCGMCNKQGEPKTLPRCSRCKAVRYCSTQCQSRDWPRHKITCGESSVDGPASLGAGGESSIARTPDKPSQSSPSPQPHTNPTTPFASLFDGTFYQSPWQQARSRAQEAFPGNPGVTDDLTNDLDLTEQEVEMEIPMMPFELAGLPSFPFPMGEAFSLPPLLPAIVRVTCQQVLVLRLVSPMFLPVPPHVQPWLVEDSQGQRVPVFFEMDSPAPYFRFHDLQPGHFLCVKDAGIILVVQLATRFIKLKDASLIRVFKP